MKACCEADTTAAIALSDLVVLVGNPNCGKTTLFNALTGARQKTGNWPGVTVERKEGRWCLADGTEVRLVDLPGVYSLSSQSPSIDEKIARDFILQTKGAIYINVVDGTNLSQGLFLTLQLRELGVPVVVALNMMDLAEKNGIQVDVNALSELLGCPVIPISAREQLGLKDLQERLM
ncbi:MAG: GTP-binding protein, partial [Gammaproteobacteria bacterium]